MKYIKGKYNRLQVNRQIRTSRPKFTWRGPIYHGGQRIYEKLDRVLCNEEWHMDFSESHEKVLTRVAFSDHHPILIMSDML